MRTSSTIESQGGGSTYYTNGRAGTNLIGSQQQRAASNSLEKQLGNPNNISIDVDSINLNVSSTTNT